MALAILSGSAPLCAVVGPIVSILKVIMHAAEICTAIAHVGAYGIRLNCVRHSYRCQLNVYEFTATNRRDIHAYVIAAFLIGARIIRAVDAFLVVLVDPARLTKL